MREVIPWHQVEQRIGTARLGTANGRWSPIIGEMAIALAPTASALISADLWVEWLDELQDEIPRIIARGIRRVVHRRTYLR